MVLRDTKRSATRQPATQELSETDLERVVAGKEGSFARKVLWAIYSSSGFYPGNNEPWRYE
jgi:hypothetical protein